MKTGTRSIVAGALVLLVIEMAANEVVHKMSMQTDTALTVPQAEREAESARLKALGADLSTGNPVLRRPWDPPYTRRSFVVPQAWFTTRRPDSVSADALGLDLPILEHLMERAYGGWDVARKRGWDWHSWFTDWEAMLNAHAGESLRLADAFAPMKQLMAFQLDNHTTIPLVGPRFGSTSQSAVIARAPNAACPEFKTTAGAVVPLDVHDPSQQPRRAKRWVSLSQVLADVTYISLPSSRGEPQSIHCGAEWIPMVVAYPRGLFESTREEMAARDRLIRELSGATVDEPNVKLLEPTVAYARMPTFNEKNAQLIEQRAAGWPEPTSAERVLIVDLRDNDGGTADFTPIARWVDERRTEPGQKTDRHVGASCLYHALRWGYFTFSTRGVTPPASPTIRWRVRASIDELAQPSPTDCPATFTDSSAEWGYRQHTMAPAGNVGGHIRIVVLINNGCASDCEFMTLLLASLPETVIVGSNTFGVGQFIQPGYSVLPHTRLPFRIALGTSDNYGDKRSFDGYGLDVDVLLSTPEDQSPENIRALARYLGGK